MVHSGALAWGQEQAGVWEGAWVPGLAVWGGVQGFPQASPLPRGRDGSPHPPHPPCWVLGRSEDMEGGGLQRNTRAPGRPDDEQGHGVIPWHLRDADSHPSLPANEGKGQLTPRASACSKTYHFWVGLGLKCPGRPCTWGLAVAAWQSDPTEDRPRDTAPPGSVCTVPGRRVCAGDCETRAPAELWVEPPGGAGRAGGRSRAGVAVRGSAGVPGQMGGGGQVSLAGDRGQLGDQP